MDKPDATWRDDPAIEAFLELLDGNPTAKGEMQGLMLQIMQMQEELKATTRELASLRQELAEAQVPRVKNMLTRAVTVLERSLADLTARIENVKTAIIEGCKKAVTAVREHGISALANTAQFFQVGTALEAVGREANRAAARCDRALVVVHERSASFHEAGRLLRSAGRVLRGGEPIPEAKGPGGIARTLDAVYRREKAVFGHVADRVNQALTHLQRLEQTAERKPPIHETMKKLNEKIAREQRERPAPAIEHEGR